MPKQILFAAVDNAATRKEWDGLLDAVAQDPALKKSWSQVWEWRDARDGVCVKKGGCDFTAAVMAAIASTDQTAGSNVVALPVVRAPAAVPARSWKTWVPVSAAAGALAAALLFGLGKSGPAVTAAPMAVAAVAPTAAAPAAAALHWVAGDAKTGTSPDAETAALLDSYLVEHSSHEVTGTLAGARFAVQTASFQAGE